MDRACLAVWTNATNLGSILQQHDQRAISLMNNRSERLQRPVSIVTIIPTAQLSYAYGVRGGNADTLFEIAETARWLPVYSIARLS